MLGAHQHRSSGIGATWTPPVDMSWFLVFPLICSLEGDDKEVGFGFFVCFFFCFFLYHYVNSAKFKSLKNTFPAFKKTLPILHVD